MTIEAPQRRDVGRPDSTWSVVSVTLLLGALVGVLWPLAVPSARGLGDGGETQVAGDLTLGVLCLLAGVACAVAVARRPGPNPARRLALVLALSTVMAVVAWGIGRLGGAPVLHATGVLLLWPLTVAVVHLVRSVVGLLIHGE